jgi:hypothetical protein
MLAQNDDEVEIVQKIGSQLAQQAMGGLAACLLAGSCVDAMVQDPEVGMLLVSGHVDVLSAKVWNSVIYFQFLCHSVGLEPET